MAAGTLYTYPENFRAYKVLAAANYSGYNLNVDGAFQFGTTNKTPEFMSKFPLGKVPAFESSNGVCLNESNAIAAFVANDALNGSTAEQKSQVMQWTSFADQEILPAVCTWVFPCMGIMQFNKSNTERAKEEIKAAMKVLNDVLASRKFLTGDNITLADLSVATNLLLAYEWVMEPAFRSPFPHVNKWFETVVSQTEVKKALPAFNMCEKMAQFDAKKFASMSGADKKKSGEKKESKEKPKEQAPKEEKPAAEQPAEPKKSKSPFDEFPASEKFVVDEWKKVYSNEETVSVAMPWFWEKFDADKYSLWYGEYEHVDQLSETDFMNVNLIGGMQQRLDGLRKYGFGVNLYFHKPKKAIGAVYLSRGPNLPFKMSPDLNVDAESYIWRKLDISNAADKKIVTEYFTWEGDFDGKEYYDGKVFK